MVSGQAGQGRIYWPGIILCAENCLDAPMVEDGDSLSFSYSVSVGSLHQVLPSEGRGADTRFAKCRSRAAGSERASGRDTVVNLLSRDLMTA